MNRQKQKGVAAVELAFLLIPLITITFGITEYGRAMTQYNTLTKGVRDAARYLSQLPAGPANDDAAKCLAAFGNIDCTAPPLLPGLAKTNVAITDAVSDPANYLNQATGSGSVNLVKVTVSGYQFVSLVSFVAPNFTFAPISATMRQL